MDTMIFLMITTFLFLYVYTDQVAMSASIPPPPCLFFKIIGPFGPKHNIKDGQYDFPNDNQVFVLTKIKWLCLLASPTPTPFTLFFKIFGPKHIGDVSANTPPPLHFSFLTIRKKCIYLSFDATINSGSSLNLAIIGLETLLKHSGP